MMFQFLTTYVVTSGSSLPALSSVLSPSLSLDGIWVEGYRLWAMVGPSVPTATFRNCRFEIQLDYTDDDPFADDPAEVIPGFANWDASIVITPPFAARIPPPFKSEATAEPPFGPKGTMSDAIPVWGFGSSSTEVWMIPPLFIHRSPGLGWHARLAITSVSNVTGGNVVGFLAVQPVLKT